ncbi:MAG: hypothetical protein ACW99A_07590 [Candidatus Kariarchaeaceae archaeon]
MSISIGGVIPAILILFPIVVLFRQYQLTRSKDYLIFCLGFIAILLEILLDAVLNINQIPNLSSGDYSETTYLLFVKLRYLNFTIPATMFYFVGKRSRYESMIDKKSIIIIIWWLTIAVLITQMNLIVIPEKSKLWFLTVYSTVDAGQKGAAYFSDSLSIGQGYEFILIIYQTACVAYLLYAFIRLENTYDYDKFNKIVIFWSLTLSSFIIGNFFKLLIILDIAILNYSQIETVQFVSFFLVAIMSIFYSEGLLLSTIQINRVFQLYREKDKINEIERSGITSLFMSKPTDYLRHVEKHYNEGNVEK